jgi:uncharacterized membrane protein
VTDTPSQNLTPRHWIALTALISGLVALYLHLFKLGLTGPLACTAGQGCEIAQFSRYGSFLGIDVALIGALGYAMILAVALIGVSPRHRDDPRITTGLMLLVIPAFLFTLRLKYAEFIILKTFCPWCAISAVIITLQVILVFVDRQRVRR